MFINQRLLGQLQAVRDLRNQGTSAEHLKRYKKTVWAAIHAMYHIPMTTKLKVELDGPSAGELRHKAGGTYDGPNSQPRASTSVAAAGNQMTQGVSQAQVDNFAVLDDSNCIHLFSTLSSARAAMSADASLEGTIFPVVH